ncbi:MAG: hypothetical protein AABY18_05360 [Candidatus Thermoplasmatota archaeon]
MGPLVHAASAPTLHFHATGAVTYLADDVEAGWDDDAPVLFAVAA